MRPTSSAASSANPSPAISSGGSRCRRARRASSGAASRQFIGTMTAPSLLAANSSSITSGRGPVEIRHAVARADAAARSAWASRFERSSSWPNVSSRSPPMTARSTSPALRGPSRGSHRRRGDPHPPHASASLSAQERAIVSRRRRVARSGTDDPSPRGSSERAFGIRSAISSAFCNRDQPVLAAVDDQRGHLDAGQPAEAVVQRGGVELRAVGLRRRTGGPGAEPDPRRYARRAGAGSPGRSCRAPTPKPPPPVAGPGGGGRTRAPRCPARTARGPPGWVAPSTSELDALRVSQRELLSDHAAERDAVDVRVVDARPRRAPTRRRRPSPRWCRRTSATPNDPTPRLSNVITRKRRESTGTVRHQAPPLSPRPMISSTGDTCAVRSPSAAGQTGAATGGRRELDRRVSRSACRRRSSERSPSIGHARATVRAGRASCRSCLVRR